MKKSWIYVIIGLFVASVVFLVLKARSWVSKVQYGIANGVKLTSITTQNIQLYLPIWFYNSTPFNLVASNLDLDIYFDQYYISSITSPKSYMLKTKQNSTYPITINIKPYHLLKYLTEQGQAIDDKDWLEKTKVRIKGTITMEIGLLKLNNVPISLEDNLKYYTN